MDEVKERKRKSSENSVSRLLVLLPNIVRRIFTLFNFL